MKLSHRILIASAAIGLGAGCVHTPPGTSVEIALAKKAQLIRLPVTEQAPLLVATTGGSGGPGTPVPFAEPQLPIMDDRVEAEAEAFTRGKFAMADGNDQEAIAVESPGRDERSRRQGMPQGADHGDGEDRTG